MTCSGGWVGPRLSIPPARNICADKPSLCAGSVRDFHCGVGLTSACTRLGANMSGDTSILPSRAFCGTGRKSDSRCGRSVLLVESEGRSTFTRVLRGAAGAPAATKIKMSSTARHSRIKIIPVIGRYAAASSFLSGSFTENVRNCVTVTATFSD
jgi:hypothetical protein